MSGKLEMLRQGERWWPAEIAMRGAGLALLAACYRTAMLAHRLTTAAPPHRVTLAEFGLCAAIFLLLIFGLALVAEGPGLLRRVPIPAHSAFFART
jgi:hypothetical protein